jgi:hypothetical protein
MKTAAALQHDVRKQQLQAAIAATRNRDLETMSCSERPRRIAAAAFGASEEDGAEEVCDNSSSFIEAVAKTAAVVSINNNNVASNTTADDFSSDVVANILSYLKLREIMCRRRVCKKWTEAVSKTAVSPEEALDVNNVKSYNAMSVMSTVLPNLQSVRIRRWMDDGHNRYSLGHKYSDGEDPDEEEAARTANDDAHDIEIVSNFSKLRELTIGDSYVPLNGRYPFLFNSFPLLQKLSIKHCFYLKWDLEMLAGLPLLKELECTSNGFLSGNIDNLRVLKDTLEEVTFRGCENVEGNFMALADFPQLRTLRLFNTDITVDIRDIGNEDFSTMEELALGRSTSVSGNIRSLRVLKDTLQQLTLEDCPNVDGNFMALADFPQLKTLQLENTVVTVDTQDLSNGDFARLKEFVCVRTLGILRPILLSGNTRNLRVLKDTLEILRFSNCLNMEGNLMDLADFPQLKTLYLNGTAVTGDIRDIGNDDFSKLDKLFLPPTIYGGHEYELQRISDAPELMRALYLFEKQHPSLLEDWYGVLSVDSPDWYDWDEVNEMDEYCISPPFYISLVEAGTRIGYRWCNFDDFGAEHCEVNWLDPEPDKDSSDYAKYVEELQQIKNEVGFYRGFHQPPTQEEYIRLKIAFSLASISNGLLS